MCSPATLPFDTTAPEPDLQLPTDSLPLAVAGRLFSDDCYPWTPPPIAHLSLSDDPVDGDDSPLQPEFSALIGMQPNEQRKLSRNHDDFELFGPDSQSLYDVGLPDAQQWAVNLRHLSPAISTPTRRDSVVLDLCQGFEHVLQPNMSPETLAPDDVPDLVPDSPPMPGSQPVVPSSIRSEYLRASSAPVLYPHRSSPPLLPTWSHDCISRLSQQAQLNGTPVSPSAIEMALLTHIKSRQQAQVCDEEIVRKTVSPQEAFLDYEDVDQALHASGRRLFGVGIGGSLFAPLPGVKDKQEPARASSVPPDRASTSSPKLPDRSHIRHSGHKALRQSFSSPFSVPTNAVSWTDHHPSGDDEESGEDAEGSADDEDTNDEEDEEEKVQSLEDNSQYSGKTVKLNSVNDLVETVEDDGMVVLEPPKAEPVTQTVRSSIPPITTSSPRSQSPLATPSTESTSSIVPGSSTSVVSQPVPARRTPRRPVRTVSSELALSDSDKADEQEGDEDDSDEYVPIKETSTATRRSTRKRCRGPIVEEDGDEEDSDKFSDEEFDDEEDYDDEDVVPGSSRRRYKAGLRSTAPNKRRRRVPQTQSHSVSAGSIHCPHVYPDGTMCGVIFRRPYDLERHRETIHGDGAKAKKDWVCQECKGIFSRKDALIRHARIRSHVAGV